MEIIPREGQSIHDAAREARDNPRVVAEAGEEPQAPVTMADIVEEVKLAATRSLLPAVRTPFGVYTWMQMWQRQGLGAMYQQDSGLLADEMGLGKSLIVIAYMIHRAMIPRRPRDRPKPPCLLVLPPNLILNWRAEIRRHTHSILLKIVWAHPKVAGGIRLE